MTKGNTLYVLRKRDELFTKENLVQIEFAYYQQFMRAAASGQRSQSRPTKELKKVAGLWGEKFMQYYSVAERGVPFTTHLAGAATKHRNWKTDVLP